MELNDIPFEEVKISDPQNGCVGSNSGGRFILENFQFVFKSIMKLFQTYSMLAWWPLPMLALYKPFLVFCCSCVIYIPTWSFPLLFLLLSPFLFCFRFKQPARTPSFSLWTSGPQSPCLPSGFFHPCGRHPRHLVHLLALPFWCILTSFSGGQDAISSSRACSKDAESSLPRQRCNRS